jgi:hypothetical protein
MEFKPQWNLRENSIKLLKVPKEEKLKESISLRLNERTSIIFKRRCIKSILNYMGEMMLTLENSIVNFFLLIINPFLRES